MVGRQKQPELSRETKLRVGFIVLLVTVVALEQFFVIQPGQLLQAHKPQAGLHPAVVAQGSAGDGRALSAKAKAPAVQSAVIAEALKEWRPHKQPIDLKLDLPDWVRNQPAFRSKEAMFRQYGFNLNLSNQLPLVQTWPDVRNPECKARAWPPVEEMPKVSVVIIFYNEPLSTLLRNVVAVLNRSPPELLGEIVLVDDHSVLEELKLLPDYLHTLQQDLPAGKVRLVRRDIHNGIVGARIQGAKEARFPILVILDSHAQVCDGWLEPLVGRIHGDRTRVVVPNLSGIDIHKMTLIMGSTWPPNRGSFNWRLTFDIIRADPELDIMESPKIDKKASAIKTPVMPGGLFAMDREFFFELGAYDPEILYYGAEHVEMSFRIWMCGGSMEINPCSNIGHIYREFDRFGVDTQLRSVNIGHILDRNDGRVAEVWMDEYKELFFNFRHMDRESLGDLEPRRDLRKKLQCKPFQWFLDTVCRNLYTPDFNPQPTWKRLSSHDGELCVDSRRQMDGPVSLAPCRHGLGQMISLTSNRYLEFKDEGQRHVCIRTDFLTQMPCNEAGAWQMNDAGAIRSLEKPDMCLARTFSSQDEEFRLAKCDGGAQQVWMFKKVDGDYGTMSDIDEAFCLDNWQRTTGKAMMGGCHGGRTQQWGWSDDHKLFAAFQGDNKVCLGITFEASLGLCLASDVAYKWIWEENRLKPQLSPNFCLERTLAEGEAGTQWRAEVRKCRTEAAEEQTWRLET